MRPVAIRFLTAQPGVLPVGEVTAIDGMERVRQSPGVLAADLYFGVGTTIGPLRVDADRRGYVIATGDTPEQALELADAASRKLKLTTRTDRARRVRTCLVVAAAALAAATALVGAVFVHRTVRPRLLGDSVRVRAGVLRVEYRFGRSRRRASSASDSSCGMSTAGTASRSKASIALGGERRRSASRRGARATRARRRGAASARRRRNARAGAARCGGRHRARRGIRRA